MVFEFASAPRYRSGMNRLSELMKKANLTDAELARRVGKKQPEIWRLRTYPLGKSSRPMTVEWAKRLAPALGVDAADLLPGIGRGRQYELRSDEKYINSDNNLRLTAPTEADHLRRDTLSNIAPAERPVLVPVRGDTAAGLWFEHEHMIDEEPEPIPAVPGKYSNLEQFAYRVSGLSMNKKRIHHGDYVICVNYFDVRAYPESGDIVVVERRRGHLIERSCKELQVVGDGYELWPRSTDPRFADPIRIKNRHDAEADDGTQIEIVGLVIAVHVPIGR
jgi:SOS-response transcriptional repressor LexA